MLQNLTLSFKYKKAVLRNRNHKRIMQMPFYRHAYYRQHSDYHECTSNISYMPLHRSIRTMAVALFTTCIASCSNAPSDPYFNRGYEKQESGDHKGAISEYNKSLKINHDWHTTYYNRGLSKFHLNDYEGAIIDYSFAILMKPDYGVAYGNRGFKNHLKDYQGAIVDFTKAVEINSQDSLAYRGRARAKHLVKDYRGALADFDTSIKIDPQELHAYNNRGMVKFDLNNKKGACSDFKKAASLGNEVTTKWLNSERGAWCRKM